MTNIATEISPETIKSIVEAVSKHLVDTHGVCNGLESYLVKEEGPTLYGPPDVFLLEREKEFKFGNGKELIAITDGGKNKFGKPIKCVRYFNYYLGITSANRMTAPIRIHTKKPLRCGRQKSEKGLRE